MYKILFCFLFLISTICLNAQFNVELIANVQLTEEQGSANDIWGYVSPSGTEYAIMGTTKGTVIYSLQSISSPQEILFIPGENSIWRDIKQYGEYLYVTADAGDQGLLIIDMRDIQDIKHVYRKPEILDSNGIAFVFGDCHNIHIDENGIIYLAGCESRGTDMFDANIDPWDPPHIGAIESPYHHDNFVKGDTLYASQIFEGEMAMYDVSDKQNPVFMGSAGTSTDFTHNAWTDPAQNYAFTTDERPESNVDAYDISDPQNIKRLDKFKPPGTEGTGAIPHNTHYINQYLVTSWYTEGVIITDVSDPNNMVMVANYDTYLGPSGGSAGCWGTTPYLPSGIVLASDRNTGLYVLDVDYKRATRLEGTVIDSFSGNPIKNVQLRILNGDYEDVTLTNPLGEYKTGQVSSGTFQVELYHPRYKDKIIEINLSEGETTIADVELVPSDLVKTYFKVVDARTNQPLSNAKINIRNNGNDIYLATDFEGLADTTIFNGVYETFIGKWGYKNTGFQDFIVEEENQHVIRLAPGYMDDFAVDLGWEVEVETEAEEFKGAWELDIPAGTGNSIKYNVDADVEGDLSNKCYITGNWEYASYTSHVVRNGKTTLISPPMDMTKYNAPKLEFSLWMVAPALTSDNNALDIYLVAGSREEMVYSHDIGMNESKWSSPVTIPLENWSQEQNLQMKLVVNDDGTAPQLIEAALDQFIVKGQLIIPSEINEDELNLVIFPNPADNEVHIRYDYEEILRVDILDVTGKLIGSYEPAIDFRTIVPTINYPSGNYIARVILRDNTIKHGKFQVAH